MEEGGIPTATSVAMVENEPVTRAGVVDDANASGVLDVVPPVRFVALGSMVEVPDGVNAPVPDEGTVTTLTPEDSALADIVPAVTKAAVDDPVEAVATGLPVPGAVAVPAPPTAGPV